MWPQVVIRAAHPVNGKDISTLFLYFRIFLFCTHAARQESCSSGYQHGWAAVAGSSAALWLFGCLNSGSNVLRHQNVDKNPILSKRGVAGTPHLHHIHWGLWVEGRPEHPHQIGVSYSYAWRLSLSTSKTWVMTLPMPRTESQMQSWMSNLLNIQSGCRKSYSQWEHTWAWPQNKEVKRSRTAAGESWSRRLADLESRVVWTRLQLPLLLSNILCVWACVCVHSHSDLSVWLSEFILKSKNIIFFFLLSFTQIKLHSLSSAEEEFIWPDYKSGMFKSWIFFIISRTF